MKCPVNVSHKMVEIAEAVWQCQACGAGPLTYWSMSSVEQTGFTQDCLAISWNKNTNQYVAAAMSWPVFKNGNRVPGEVRCSSLGHIPREELDDYPLPIIDPNGEILVLKRLAFQALGPKTYSARGRSRKS